MTMMMTEEVVKPESVKEEYKERHLVFTDEEAQGHKFRRLINENHALVEENIKLKADIEDMKRRMDILTDAARVKVESQKERIAKLEKALIDATIA